MVPISLTRVFSAEVSEPAEETLYNFCLNFLPRLGQRICAEAALEAGLYRGTGTGHYPEGKEKMIPNPKMPRKSLTNITDKIQGISTQKVLLRDS